MGNIWKYLCTKNSVHVYMLCAGVWEEILTQTNQCTCQHQTFPDLSESHRCLHVKVQAYMITRAAASETKLE